jgi:hypothetical protein
MGDRATFVIEQENDSAIYLYGHNAGYEMLSEFAKALDHALYRINAQDEVYATRQIVSYMTRNDTLSEYGWGLSTYFCDSEHSVPVLNVKSKTVKLLPHRWDTQFDLHATPDFIMPVDAFIRKFRKD